VARGRRPKSSRTGVRGAAYGGIHSLGYSELIAPALKAIQELAEQNESLSRRVAALEG